MHQAAPRGSEGNRTEQRALLLSILGVVVVAVGSVVWGLLIESDIVILNGVFSLFSAVSGGLSLLAARMVARPEETDASLTATRMSSLWSTPSTASSCF